MRALISNSKISGKVCAPPSKSYAHRLLISAFLSNTKSVITNVSFSKDVLATLGVLKVLGGKFKVDNDKIMFEGRDDVVSQVVADCNESGSTLRFMLPIASALGIKTKFVGSERLLSRPIDNLVLALNKCGANVNDLTVNGKLTAGEYEIDGSESSQFVSGLLFALSVIDGKSTLTVKGKKVSTNYIDMTLDTLEKFGAKIQKIDNTYIVEGNSFKNKCGEYAIEGDYSNAAFLLSAGAIFGEVTVDNLNLNSKQGDIKILSVLKDFGANVETFKNSVTVKKGNLNGIQVDIEEIPDLAQIIAVVAGYAKGKTVIKNVSRLRIKESDRAVAIINMLTASKIKCFEEQNSIVIYGGNPKRAIFDGGNDHRTVMSSAVLALGADGNSQIEGIEAVNKSYPNFFKDLSAIGGKISGDI